MRWRLCPFFHIHIIPNLKWDPPLKPTNKNNKIRWSLLIIYSKYVNTLNAWISFIWTSISLMYILVILPSVKIVSRISTWLKFSHDRIGELVKFLYFIIFSAGIIQLHHSLFHLSVIATYCTISIGKIFLIQWWLWLKLIQNKENYWQYLGSRILSGFFIQNLLRKYWVVMKSYPSQMNTFIYRYLKMYFSRFKLNPLSLG